MPNPNSSRSPPRDGDTVHARLYRADAATDRLLCWLHGGPTDQWQVTFMPRVAYWRAQGWNVLVPDHRGSTGHGRAYQQAMRGRWGELDVSDTVDAIGHAHARLGLAGAHGDRRLVRRRASPRSGVAAADARSVAAASSPIPSLTSLIWPNAATASSGTTPIRWSVRCRCSAVVPRSLADRTSPIDYRHTSAGAARRQRSGRAGRAEPAFVERCRPQAATSSWWFTKARATAFASRRISSTSTAACRASSPRTFLADSVTA